MLQRYAELIKAESLALELKGCEAGMEVGGVIPKYEFLHKGSLILPTFVPPPIEVPEPPELEV